MFHSESLTMAIGHCLSDSQKNRLRLGARGRNDRPALRDLALGRGFGVGAKGYVRALMASTELLSQHPD